MTSEDTSNWAQLLLDPGQDGKESTGLDARLLASMIKSGSFPREILTTHLCCKSEFLPLPGNLLLQVKERSGFGRCGKNGEVTLPGWAAWILMRGRSSNGKMTEAIELLHDSGIVPWAEPVFQELGLNVVGMDLLAAVRNKRHSDIDLAAVFRKAIEALPAESVKQLNARAGRDRIHGWEVSARTANDPQVVEALAAGGLSGLYTNGSVFAVGKNTFSALEAKMVAGAKAPLARRWFLNGGDTVDKRHQRLEHLDKIWIAQDENYQRTRADFIVNTLVAGSSQISKDVSLLSRNGETEGWPVHISGQGIGYTLLAMAAEPIHADGKLVTPKLIQAIEDHMKLPWWRAGAQQEAAGLEGSGVTEWQCIKLARLLSHEEKENDWPIGELGQVLTGLARQREIDVRPEKIAYALGQGRKTWLDWAREGGSQEETIRKEVAIHPDDTWQLARLLENKLESVDGLELLDGVECLGRALVARYALEHAQQHGDDEATAQWFDVRLTTWSLMVMYGALLGTRGSSQGIDTDLLAEVLDSQFLVGNSRANQVLEGMARLLDRPVLLSSYHGKDDPAHSTWDWIRLNDDTEERKPGEIAQVAFNRARLGISLNAGATRNAPRM